LLAAGSPELVYIISENGLNPAGGGVFGLPAISIPCGFTQGGLPIALQIVGAPFAESTVLALAHAYEQATEWHLRRPKLDFAA